MGAGRPWGYEPARFGTLRNIGIGPRIRRHEQHVNLAASTGVTNVTRCPFHFLDTAQVQEIHFGRSGAMVLVSRLVVSLALERRSFLMGSMRTRK